MVAPQRVCTVGLAAILMTAACGSSTPSSVTSPTPAGSSTTTSVLAAEPVSPADNATVTYTGAVTFTARNLSQPAANVFLGLQVATDAAFAHSFGTTLMGQAADGSASLTLPLTYSVTDLPHTLYWRVQPSRDNKTTGDYSATRKFTFSDPRPVPVHIDAPVWVLRDPSFSQARASFTIRNVARPAGVTNVTYRFELRDSRTNQILAAAIQAEGSGSTTTWALASDLPIATRVHATVRAIDTLSGTEGDAADTGTLTIAANDAVPVTLTVQSPAGCGPILSTNAMAEPAGSDAMHVVTTGSLMADLTRTSSGYRGTIGGDIGGTSFSADRTTSSAAETNAFVNGDGSVSGSFDGASTWIASLPRACTATGFTWVVRRR